MDRSRQWATRIANEAQLHDENSFLTLTYRDEDLPDDYSISVREMQLFLKRLRKAIAPVKIRFFACGEYGEQTWRPHYHLIIFGFGFPDRTPWRRSGPHVLYRSELLERCWPYGNCEIGSVTSQSGGYVARYVVKKVGGDASAQHYQRLNPITGEIVWVQPEFAVMSRRPGIGGDWFDKFESDCFPSDFLVVDGKKVPIPRYYANKLRNRFEFEGSEADSLVPHDDLRSVQQKRRNFARSHSDNSTPERLAVREELAHLRAQQLKREVE